MRIMRSLLPQIQQSILPGKALVLYGPRQVGKTTLAQDFMAQTSLRSRWLNADELVYREALSSQDARILGDLIGDAQLLIIDEAQRVPEIGLNLKIITDSFPAVTVLATGSASFDLANKISEPLTGRKLTFTLYPLSYDEMRQAFGAIEARAWLERWLVWGGYPEIVTTQDGVLRERLLGELVGSYLYQDVIAMEGLRRADKIVDLLRLLAFQIGQEVSIAELAAGLGMHRNTVERYLDLLEKVFVIYKVGGFSRNLRKEVTKNPRYYFYDNGVRNCLIRNYNPLNLRADAGLLWENYLFMERIKFNQRTGRGITPYFWRTYDQKEIDCIEESGGDIFGYEFKWQDKEIRKATRREFMNAYPQARLEIINRGNFETFVL